METVVTNPATEAAVEQSSPVPRKSANADRWLGVVLLVLGGVMFFETFFFKTFDWDPLGMAFWPRVLLGCLAVFVAIHIVKGNVGDEMEPLSMQAVIQFGVCIAYLFGLMYLGFFIATPILVFGLGLRLREFSPRAVVLSAVAAASSTAIIYLIFEFGMSVELPRGIWG